MTADHASGQLDSFESEHLVGSIMDDVRRTPQDRRRTLASVRSAFVAVLAAGVLIAGGLIAVPRLTSFQGFGGNAVLTYHADGLQFDYPADWNLTPSSFAMGPDMRIVGFVGTGQGATPCFTPDAEGARLCSMFSTTLAPNQLVVEIAVDDSAPLQTRHWLNPPISEPNTIVGGMPAITGLSVLPAHKNGADVAICWVLQSRQSANRHYVLTAALRGPDRAALQAQIDALLASVRIDP